MAWLVTQGNNQFGVDSLNELKQMASDGRLVAGDMVQPPGAKDWLYAAEIPELKGIVRDMDLGGAEWGEGGKAIGMAAIALGLVAFIIIGASVAIYTYSLVPENDTVTLGEGGSMKYSEMLVTATGASLRDEPTANANAVVSLDKDATLDLLAKRGEFYKARTKNGQEGWIAVDQVIPMYQLGGQQARAEYDPLYNPDRYVEVGNAAWMLAEDKKRSGRMTVFRFQMSNSSMYDLTDLKLLATVKDAKGNELERVEFPVQGVIPGSKHGGGSTFVGTLMPEDRNGKPQLLTEATFQKMAETDPDLQLRWVDGVEVEMKTKDFALAEIDIVEIRAVPAEK